MTVRYEPGILVVMRGLGFVSLASVSSPLGIGLLSLAIAACTLDFDNVGPHADSGASTAAGGETSGAGSPSGGNGEGGSGGAQVPAAPGCLTDNAEPTKPPIAWSNRVEGCAFQSLACGEDACLPNDGSYCFYRTLAAERRRAEVLQMRTAT